MAIMNMVGGGTSLNFYVVGGTVAPSNPKDNTIWVNTDTEITNWIFSAAQPETAETGMVWICTGTASPVAFNALKKNGITVYPIVEKQYVGGAWVAKTAMIYQDGTWKELGGTLFLNGNQIENITGGWSNSITEFAADGWDRDGAAVPDGSSVTIADTMALSVNVGSNSNYQDAVAVGTRNKIDLTGYNKIKVVCNLASKNGNTNGVAKVAINPKLITPTRSASVTADVDIPEGANIVELDVSQISGLYHVLIGGLSGTVGYALTVSSVILE